MSKVNWNAMKWVMMITLFSFVIGLSQAFAVEDRRIRVHNESSKRITKLFASPIDMSTWDYNMIRGPSDWIRVGEVRMADINDGTGYCRYDLLAVLADGRKAIKHNANVCELTDWHITD